MIIYNLGKSFPIGGVIIGYLFLITGFLMLFEIPLLGLLVLIIGLLMSLTKSIITIDPQKQKIKSGSSFLGFKFGEWQDYSTFPYISILRNDVKSKMISRGNAESHLKDVFFNIHLLSESHRNKILVLKFPDVESAKKEALKLSEKLGKSLVDFSPVISQSNSERRNRRS